MDNKYYVYIHINPIKNEVFYVGKGCGNRCYSKSLRNRYWLNIVAKYGFLVEIIESNLSQDVACKMEIDLIKKIGRIDLKEGTLVNMTDGGDGNNNFSAESRKAISEKAKLRPSPKKGKPVTKESRDKISKTLKEKYLRGEWKPNMSGLNTEEARKKISESKKGKPSNSTGSNRSAESNNKSSIGIKKYYSNPEFSEKIRNSNIKALISRKKTSELKFNNKNMAKRGAYAIVTKRRSFLDKTPKAKGCVLAKDDGGYFIYTNNWASERYIKIFDIPKEVIEFCESTRRINQFQK